MRAKEIKNEIDEIKKLKEKIKHLTLIRLGLLRVVIPEEGDQFDPPPPHPFIFQEELI